MANKLTKQPAKLQEALVLFKYILRLFGCRDLAALSGDLKDPALEGIDDEGTSRIFYALKTHLYAGYDISEEKLYEYDRHIVQYTREINEFRKDKITWKYFQYLALLFTEVYLDRYFSDKQALLDGINRFLSEDFNLRAETWHDMPDFTEDNLNKLAFWCATGSGKTLMMHVNIKQYLYYSEKHNAKKLNRVLILTPNEGLSNQHVDELKASGFYAEIFNKFLIARPLGIFVGSSVNAVQTVRGRQVSDVTQILLFIQSFIDNPEEFTGYIKRLLNPDDGIKNRNGYSLFANSFMLVKEGYNPSEEDKRAVETYNKVVKTIFHSEVSNARLHIDKQKGGDEEIGLRMGNADYFGVINVGDSSKLLSLCESNGLMCETKEFGTLSLFSNINDENSSVNLLIGSKKFNEGWSSWRVSVMGLMNVAPIREIQEVKNAIKTYELYKNLNPFNVNDLLKAHATMMEALTDDAGHFRRGGVGVYSETGLVHRAPPADRVPFLMSDLFDWLKNSKDHLLIRSCVFHYEFEFIHPFSDGNGRTGRLWQSLILGKLHPLFEHLPVENMVYANQQEYYDAISKSTNAAESGPFIDFMLNEIFKTLKSHQGEPLDKVPNKIPNKVHDKVHDKIKGLFPEISETAIKVVDAMIVNNRISAPSIAENLNMSERMVRKHIAILKSAGIISRVGSNKNGHWEVVK